jgi:hypothetical protein
VHAVGEELKGGGEFHPLPPQRIYDSRSSDGGPINEPSPGAKPVSFGHAPFDVNVLGQGGIPSDPSTVLAVVVNITVTGSNTPGVLGAYATGAQPATLTSLLNFDANALVSNMAILSPGNGGKITVDLFGGAGSVQVVIDVFGWLSTSAQPAGISGGGSRLEAITPGRILDTRDGTNVRPGPIGPRSSIVVPVLGVDSVNPSVPDVVPNDPNIVGVVLNIVGITARPGGAATYVSATPTEVSGGAATSNLNLQANQIKANLAILPVGPDGTVRLFNYAGQTDVAIDVVGYLIAGKYAPTSSTGRIVPLAAPFRTLDTREGAFGAAPLGPGVGEAWSFRDFQGSVKLDSTWVGEQSAVIGNLTNASLTRQYASVPVESYLTAWPSGMPRPLTSYVDTNEDKNVNGIPIAVPNLAILTYGTDAGVSVYNYAGSAHYIFDASAVVLK